MVQQLQVLGNRASGLYGCMGVECWYFNVIYPYCARRMCAYCAFSTAGALMG